MEFCDIPETEAATAGYFPKGNIRSTDGEGMSALYRVAHEENFTKIVDGILLLTYSSVSGYTLEAARFGRQNGDDWSHLQHDRSWS